MEKKNQFLRGILREDSAISSDISSLELSFNVTQRNGDARFLDDDHTSLVNLGPIALFNVFLDKLLLVENKLK